MGIYTFRLARRHRQDRVDDVQDEEGHMDVLARRRKMDALRAVEPQGVALRCKQPAARRRLDR